MGLIATTNKNQIENYLSAEDAMKYLKHIEKESNYSDIAKFLIRRNFSKCTSRGTFTKTVGDEFYVCDDTGYDENSVLFSAVTLEFLQHVALHNELEQVNFMTGKIEAFNIYWKNQPLPDG